MRLRTSEHDDYLQRLIRQAAAALRLLRRRLATGPDAPDDVRRDAAGAAHALLGAEAMLLTHLDAPTAVRLTGDAHRVALWSALLETEADAAEANGDPTMAQSRRARAMALRDAGVALWGELPELRADEDDA